ncbi:MAG: hydroxymethylbilane synthase [Verrucomicrobiales bacterium]
MSKASSPILRVGTRGSELALAQAELFESAVAAARPDLSIKRVIIRTTGDQRQDIRLAELSGKAGTPVDKGVFTKELEIALEAGEIDVAVHSLKDVPTEVGEKFSIAGAMERAPVEDVLVVADHRLRGLCDLPAGMIVATSSPRRKFQLLAMRPDLKVVEIRGNVPTRLRKVAANGQGHALLLARAGLERLGWDPASGEIAIDDFRLGSSILPERLMLPAAGQGAIGLEIRAGDESSASVVAAITHAETWARVRCEREFLRLLQAGCHTPVGIRTRVDKAGRLSAAAVVFSEHQPLQTPLRARASGSARRPLAVAARLHQSLA